MACDGSNINPVALAILNAKLPNGQFAVPSPQVISAEQRAGCLGSVAGGAVDLCDSGALPGRPVHRGHRSDSESEEHTVGKVLLLARANYRAVLAERAANVPGWGTNELDRNTMFVLSDTHVFNSNLVNIARFGYMRFDGLRRWRIHSPRQAIGEGTPTGAVGPTVERSGIYGRRFHDRRCRHAFRVAGDELLHLAGHGRADEGPAQHALWSRVQAAPGRCGLSVTRRMDLLKSPAFDDFLLGQSAAQNGSPLGVSNVGTSQSGGGIFRRNERYTDFAVFAQDDIKLTPRLTMNAGLRYEIFGAPTETDGRLANFNADIAMQGPVPPTGNIQRIYSAVELSRHDTGRAWCRHPMPGLWRTPHGDVSPRLGFAWQMMEKPVLGAAWRVSACTSTGTRPALSESGCHSLPIATAKYCRRELPTGRRPCRVRMFPWCCPIRAIRSSLPRSAASPLPFIEGTDPNLKDGKNAGVQPERAVCCRRMTTCCRWDMLEPNRMHRPGTDSSSTRLCWPVRRTR